MSEETTHPDAVCMASNLPCGDLSEALIERDTLRTRVAELEKDLSGVIGELQRLQPGGSPPPGGPVVLAGWIRQHVAKRILDLEEMLKSYD